MIRNPTSRATVILGRQAPAPHNARRLILTSLRPILFAVVIGGGAGLVAIGLLPLFGSAGAAVKVVDSKFLGQSTAPLQLPTLSERTTIYAADGSVLAVVYRDQNRQVFPFAAYNQVTKDAVLAIEDHGYYQHGAVDVTSIIRALFANLRAGSVVQGGSTIAQQLVKNTETGSEQTLQRKILEAQDAIRLEKTYTKDQILGQYLNTIYMGNGVYGVGTAAEYYFNKTPDKLNLAQASLLAAMIAGPEKWNPVEKALRPGALARRNSVLDDMLRYGFITQVQHDRAMNVPIRLSSAGRTANTYGPEPYWVDYIRQQFFSNPKFGKSPAERAQLFYQGGLRIYTTLQPKYQKVARASLRSRYPLKTDPQSSVVSVDSNTGAIEVMVDGNETYGTHVKLHQSSVNYAVSGRQTGSAFKAYTLAAALEQGVSPNAVFSTKSPITIPNCGGGVTYTLSNSEGNGNGFATLRQATADSINVVFAQLVNLIGPASVVSVAHDMGITSDLFPYCSITLGVFNVSPLEMASGYSTLSNGGVHCVPYSISKILGRTGKPIYKASPTCGQAIPPDVAATETDLLRGVISGGTGTKAQLADYRPEAGKTGTGENYTNAWFVGYVPQVTTAVWVGYARGSVPMLDVHGFRGFGGDLAAPVWHDVMTALTRDLPVQQFPTPPPTKSGSVPNVVGKQQQDAITILTKAFFTPFVQMAPSTMPLGTVFQQNPPGGANAPLGTTVTIFVSNGKIPKSVVPNVVGQQQGAAKSAITGAGFAVSVTKQDVTEKTQDGIVLSQAPGGGTKAVQGSTVTIVVGKFVGTPTPTPTPSGPLADPHGAAGAMWLLAPWLLPASLLPLWRLRRRR